MTAWSEEEGLFEEPERRELHPGDKVVVRTIWGEEDCEVVEVGTIDGFPMVSIKTPSGDRATVSRASIKE